MIKLKYAEETQSIFKKGESYTFQIDWQSSNLATKPATPGNPAEGPDYDYTFKVQPQGSHNGILIDAYDPKTKTIGNPILAENANDVATTEAEFKQNYEGKRACLFPVEVISDLNNDGQFTATDNSLRDAALASGTDNVVKDKGTEYMFVNDKLSNGLWDVEDAGATSYRFNVYERLPGPPTSHKDDDDVEKIKISVGKLNKGVLWFSHLAISDMQFFKSPKCLPSELLGSMSSEDPYDLSSGPLPEFVYLRVTPGSTQSNQRGGVLQMHVGKTVEEIWGPSDLRLTMVRQLTAPDYFNAARDYILENNTRLCIREHGYPLLSTDPDIVFRMCIMREEATTMTAFDALSATKKGIQEVYPAIPTTPQSPAVIINGSQCFWNAGWGEMDPAHYLDMFFNIVERCHGRVIRGAVTAAISSDNFDVSTLPAGGSPLAGPDPLGFFPGPDGIQGNADDVANPDAASPGGKYVGLNSGIWTFAAGQASGADALGGLSSNYDSQSRADLPHQMIGYATGKETGKGCVFTATQIKGVGSVPAFKDDLSSSGVPPLSPSADTEAVKLLILDSGGGSIATMHIDPAGTMQRAYMGRKTILGIPYYLNNYLSFHPTPPRP